MRLAGRTVIVTGGAQGIGAAYCHALAAEGVRVALCDVRDPEPVAEAIRATGGEALAGTCDVTDPFMIAAFVKRTLEWSVAIDGLVNNAAILADFRLRPLELIGSDEFDRVMAVNVRGAFEMTKAVLPHMRARRSGSIVNISSGTVFKGSPMMLPYVASKGAVIAMTRAVAREVGADGVRVNCVAPGLTMTEAVTGNDSYPPELLAAMVGQRCLPREQVASDLTGTVLFLLSGESEFVTGQTIVVDGGAVMH